MTLDAGSASARVRILDHRDGLRALGIEVTIHELPRGTRAQRRLFRSLSDRHAVVLHRVLLGELALVALRRRVGALVLDADDAIFCRPFRDSRSHGLQHKLERTVRACDRVVVGNAWLRSQLEARQGRIRVLPPASPLPNCSPTSDDVVRLVWVGSRATLPYLEDLGPVLADVPDAVLEVVADVEPQLPGVEVRFTPWSLEDEDAVLARSSIGLYPLRNDPWSQGKCAYKVRRYMAFGLPTVSSPWGAGQETLNPPEAGLLAETQGEWREALTHLLGDDALRRRMGQRARVLALGRDAPGDRTHSLARILREAVGISLARGHGAC